MSGSQRRETIHLSLGPTANAVTSHLLNLEGLSVTASASDSLPVCDPLVTHRRDNAKQVWVPRVLMVDETHNLNSNRPSTRDANNATTELTDTAASSWGGAVQELNVQNFSLDNFHAVEDVVANLSYNSNLSPTSQTQPAWLSSWQQTASQLAYAPYSQYRISEADQSFFYSQQSQPQTEQSQSRQVDWDDLGEEPDEDENEKAAREERQKRTRMRQWDQERSQFEEQLAKFWNQQSPPTDMASQLQGEATTEETSVPSESELDNLSWMDYWMPPHPSPLSSCTYGLPSTSAASTLEGPPLDSFNYSNYSPSLLEEFWEKVRVDLEQTDVCQGFTILTEGCGMYAGMTAWLLQELQQECRAAGRWVFHVAYDKEDVHATNDESVRSSELARAQAQVRDQVQRGLAMAALSDHSHVVVPLMLPSSKSRSLFRASAELAMALETATLPYRCRSSSRSTLVGWNSMSGYEEGAYPGSMSLGDYLTTLQPSPRYSLLELDTVLTANNRKRLGQVLAAGTSVECDPRMRRPPSSLGADYPGSWLLDNQFGTSPTTVSPGFLTCLSPGHAAKQDRSLHHHFGLSACMRRGVLSDNAVLSNNQQYLTCLMEGMGIRYRPETAFGLVTDQSLTRLTSAGHRYGAGSYWQYLIGAGADIPVLSVLGNTTRMYPYLHTVASDLKNALKSSMSKGYYQREVSNGTLPEVDDCEEALEQCLDLRDVYEPPNGSGLDAGEDEQYFEY